MTWIEDEFELQGASDRDLLNVDAVKWAGGEKIVERSKWTRIRGGLYARLIGTHFIEVEKCSSAWCPADLRGWAIRERRIGAWEEYVWETTYATVKGAQAAAEKHFRPGLRHPHPDLEGITPEDLASSNFGMAIDQANPTYGDLQEAIENVSDTALVDGERGPYWEAAVNAFHALADARFPGWYTRDTDELLPIETKKLKARLLR